MRRKLRRWRRVCAPWLGSLGSLGLLAIAAAGCRGAPDATAPPLSAVERRDIAVVAEAAGLVEPVRVVEMK